MLLSDGLLTELSRWGWIWSIFCGCCWLSLLVPTLFRLTWCLWYGCFVPAPSYLASDLPSLFGFSHLVLLSDWFLADLPWCGKGCSISYDLRQSSLCFCHGFGSRTPCCLPVSFLLPLIARQPLLLWLDFSLWCWYLTAFYLTFLGGYVAAPSCVDNVVFHLYWAVLTSCVMPHVCWPFRADSLLLRVSPYLYAWDWPFVSFFLWLAFWLSSAGTAWFMGCFVFVVSFLFSWRREYAA